MIRVLFVYLLLINFANSSTLEEYNNFQCSSDSEYAPPINEDSSIGWTASSSTFVYNFPKTKTKEEVIALINQYYPPYYSINPTTKTVQKDFILVVRLIHLLPIIGLGNFNFLVSFLLVSQNQHATQIMNLILHPKNVS